jgi:cyanate permease
LQSVLIERGSSAVTATWMISLLAVSVMISRLAVGYVLDLSKPGRSAAIVMLLATAGAAMLLPSTGTGATAVAILLFGISIGAELDLLAFFCARLFGTRHYAAVYGFLAMFFYIGIALGGIGYGAIRDLTGSYQSALLMTVASLFTAAMLFLILERDRRLTEARDKGAPHAAA